MVETPEPKTGTVALAIAAVDGVIPGPNPGCHHRAQKLGDLVDFAVARILQRLDIGHALLSRWGRGAKRSSEECAPVARCTTQRTE